MLLKRAAAMSVALGLAVLAATPSEAALRLAIYTGTLDFGTDVTGEFGAPLTDLTGKAFVARFTYNTARGQRVTVPGAYDVAYGGAGIGTSNPILKSTLTIAGVTRDFVPRYTGTVQTSSGIHHNSSGYGSDASYVYQHSLYMSAFTPLPLANSIEAVFPERDSVPAGGGLFQLWTFDKSGNFLNQARGGLVPLTFEVSAVPDSASWGLMILGFGLLGSSLRYRRRMNIGI